LQDEESPPVFCGAHWQIRLSIALLALTTVGVVHFSAPLYRVGILTYGKQASLIEILRWLKYT
jgi:ABC-2 type transport system permease protein